MTKLQHIMYEHLNHFKAAISRNVVMNELFVFRRSHCHQLEDGREMLCQASSPHFLAVVGRTREMPVGISISSTDLPDQSQSRW